MILTLAGFVLGALFGAVRARRRGGVGLDVLQWAAVYGLILGMVGVFVTIILVRT